MVHLPRRSVSRGHRRDRTARRRNPRCQLTARAVTSRDVSHIAVADLEYAPPGSDSLFFDVGFTVAPGEHASLIGVNGVGKSTIMRILSGELEADEGSFSLGGTV